MNKKVRLIYKLLAGFGIVVALVLGLFILGNRTIQFTSNIMQETIDQKIRPLAQINRLQSLAAQIRRLESELSGLEDYWAVSGTVDRIRKDTAVLEEGLLSFNAFVFEKADERASQLLGTWQLYRKELERTLQASLDMDLSGAKKISSYSSRPKFQFFADSLDRISFETEKKANEEYGHTLSHLKERKAFFLWISVFGIVLVALFSSIFSRSLSLRIRKLRDAAERLSKGEFDHHFRIKGKDEIEELASSFNKMRIQIKRHQEHLEELVNERTAELIIAKETAEAATQSKSDFLARMSHEIRTPLNAVTGLTSVVLKSELTAEQRDYLNKVQIASNNLLAVINDILDFSKVEAGRLELEQNPFNLDQVMEQLVDLFSNRAAQKDLELIFGVAPKVPRQLTGDPGRLTQVLTNLVENAVKFTDKGEIVVKVEPDDQAEKRSWQTALKFTVSDTGTGIGADVLPTLFDPFTQAEGYLTRKHEGTGLGLAICRRLVQLMGGTIEAQSTPGWGSTFFFTVFFDTRKEEKPRFSLPADLHGLKALVVDDSVTARQMLVDLLESFTFNVLAVDRGEKAIEALEQATADAPYQLVLLDWKMPDMDGIETARRIRTLEHEEPGTRFVGPSAKHEDPNRKPKTPIIILVTAYGFELMQERIDKSAVDTSLLKPLKPSQLFNTIMELFNHKVTKVPRIKTKRAAPHARLAGRRVLVVEDSELNRYVALALLEEAGLMVEIAPNGRVAVDKVTESPKKYYDIVLMDIQMPVMDGYEATRCIRQWEADSLDRRSPTSLPIIALTAHALKGEKEKCLAAGMDDYLTKPIDEKQLDRVLLKWIAPRQEEADTSNGLQTEGPSDDRGVLDVQGALKRLGGRRQIYVKVMRKFTPECGQAHETIVRHLAADEREAATRMAHTVKGAAATIGAVSLSPVAAELETAISDEGPDIDVLLSGFKSELEQALEAVDRFLKAESRTVSAPPDRKVTC